MASDSVLVVETGGAAAPLKEPVSWPAIWAGAIVAVAVTIVLTLAGAGLGFSLSYSAVAPAPTSGVKPVSDPRVATAE